MSAVIKAVMLFWISAWSSIALAQVPDGYVFEGGLVWMPSIDEVDWSNASSYCANNSIDGKTGWRLPTVDELKTLSASEEANAQGWKGYQTWTNTPKGMDGHYVLDIKSGQLFWDNDNSNLRAVTCVRELTESKQEIAAQMKKQSQKKQSQISSFSAGGLIWWRQLKLVKNWKDSGLYCSNKEFNGQKGWRLPTKDELSALRSSGAMNGHGWDLNYYWSSTSGKVYPYAVDLDNGREETIPGGMSSAFACVHEL